MIAFLIFAASASASPVVFTTNLDKPKTILAARDSLNYRLSDDLLKALSEINRGRPAGEQIELRTFGGNFTAAEYEEGLDGRKTTSLTKIPDTPIIDIRSKNAAMARPWFRHEEIQIEVWMQDALEFFYEGTRLGALSFKNLFRGSDFQTAEEKAALAEIGKDWERDDITDEEIEKLKVESKKLQDLADGRANEAQKNFQSNLGIASLKEIPDLDAEGGDFEALPHNVILTSIAPESGLNGIQEWLKGSQYEGRTISFDADWFEVGHVDEFISVVPAENSCGFAVISMDPGLGLELIAKENTKGLDKLIPSDYQNSSPPGAAITDSAISPLYEHLVLHKKSAAEEAKVAIVLQQKARARLQAAVVKFKKDYAALNPSCRDLPVTLLPTLVKCQDEDSMSGCSTMLPNPVNSVVLGRDLLVPDPYLPMFRAEIQSRLQGLKLKPHFVDSGFYHSLKGEAHCATNVIRSIH